jgi:hypothetical protein
MTDKTDAELFLDSYGSPPGWSIDQLGDVIVQRLHRLMKAADWRAVANLLREAHDLLLDERNWCRGSYAVTPTGRKVSASDPDAIAWCAYGASRRVAYESGHYIWLTRALEVSVPGRVCRSVADFNDHDDTTHGDVLDLYLRAIKWAERNME